MDTSDALKALADENRLRIVDLLAGGERCVCELASALDASDALVSHHVKQLREARLVRTRRIGRWLHCSLEPVAFEALAARFSALAGEARDVAVAADAAAGACCASSDKDEVWP